MLSKLLVLFGFGLLPPLASAQEPISVTERQGLCRAIYNSGECAAAIEAHQIPLSHGRARRDGVTLHLQLTAGQVLNVVQDTATVSGMDFFFLGICPGLGYYVLWAQLYEGHLVRLVNVRTGWSVLVHDMPTVSPDSHRFVTVASDGTTRLQVWRIDGDTLRREWDLVRPTGTQEHVRWLSNRRFAFADGQVADTAEIDSSGQWRLKP